MSKPKATEPPATPETETAPPPSSTTKAARCPTHPEAEQTANGCTAPGCTFLAARDDS